MAQYSDVIITCLCVLVHVLYSSHAFPTLTDLRSERTRRDTQTDTETAESYLLSALNHRSKREVLPPPGALSPEMAAHFVRMIPRTYGYVQLPAKILPPKIVPSHYYRPRVYVRVPSGYYPYPKSELFRMSELGGGYLSNLLPTFDKETPKVRVDPVPDTLPAIPQTSDNGVGVDTAPLNNFPFWNQQSSNWVWPDGVNTGSLPQAEVVQVGPQSTLFQLQNKAQNSVQALHPVAQAVADLPPVDTPPQGDNQVV